MNTYYIKYYDPKLKLEDTTIMMATLKTRAIEDFKAQYGGHVQILKVWKD